MHEELPIKWLLNVQKVTVVESIQLKTNVSPVSKELGNNWKEKKAQKTSVALPVNSIYSVPDSFRSNNL